MVIYTATIILTFINVCTFLIGATGSVSLLGAGGSSGGGGSGSHVISAEALQALSDGLEKLREKLDSEITRSTEERSKFEKDIAFMSASADANFTAMQIAFTASLRAANDGKRNGCCNNALDKDV